MIAIDPGKDKIALAFFSADRNLYQCEVLPTREACNVLSDAARGLCVIEIPQIYPHNKGDPNDLVQVALHAGRVMQAIYGAGGVVREVRPHAWKSSAPKKVMHARIVSALSAQEQRYFDSCRFSRAVIGDALDAVGIGLWYLGRLTPII